MCPWPIYSLLSIAHNEVYDLNLSFVGYSHTKTFQCKLYQAEIYAIFLSVDSHVNFFDHLENLYFGVAEIFPNVLCLSNQLKLAARLNMMLL